MEGNCTQSSEFLYNGIRTLHKNLLFAHRERVAHITRQLYEVDSEISQIRQENLGNIPAIYRNFRNRIDLTKKRLDRLETCVSELTDDFSKLSIFN